MVDRRSSNLNIFNRTRKEEENSEPTQAELDAAPWETVDKENRRTEYTDENQQEKILSTRRTSSLPKPRESLRMFRQNGTNNKIKISIRSRR